MKNSTWKQNSESGQAIVLVVLLLVAMIGMVGLAVDGGILYSARRSAQSAADNAAMAGAYALCSEGDVASASQAAATANEFDDADPEIEVVVNHPPADGPHTGDNAFVEVIINTQEQPFFIQILYSGAFEASARAVARCWQTSPAPLGLGNGLIVLNQSNPSALNGTGNTASLSVNGGIYINSTHAEAMTVGNIDILASDGIALGGNYTMGPGGSVSPPPVTGAVPIIDPLLTLPDGPTRPAGACINLTQSQMAKQTISINPGVYCTINITGNKTLVMNPGLYYIEGGVFSISGGSNVTGSGVLIYSTSGAVTMIGGGYFNLTAPDSGEYEGLLLWTSRSNTSDITITGGSNSVFQGTIYAASSRLVLSGGSGSLSLDAQVIVDRVQISGSSGVNVEYDSTLGYNPGTGSKVLEISD